MDEGLAEACGEQPPWVCEQVYEWTESSGWANAAEWFVAKPVVILAIVLVAWVINKIARVLVTRAVRKALAERSGSERLARVRSRAPSLLQSPRQENLRRHSRTQTLVSVFRGLTTAVIAFVAFVAILDVVNIALGPLVAGAGIAGVALGFGAQSLVRDFLTGTFIIIEDQYGVGDFVDLGEAIGEVEKVTLRVTQVRDLNGVLWHVPNGEILRAANNSQEWARSVLDVEVAYHTDIDFAMGVIEEVGADVAEDPGFREDVVETPEVWGVQAFGPDGIAIRMVVKTRPAAQWRVTRELRRRIKRAFDEQNIEIPFPQRTMWLRTGEGVHGSGVEEPSLRESGRSADADDAVGGQPPEGSERSGGDSDGDADGE